MIGRAATTAVMTAAATLEMRVTIVGIGPLRGDRWFDREHGTRPPSPPGSCRASSQDLQRASK